MVYYHSTKFGGHRHCSSEDIKVLVCHVISQDHLIKGHLTLWERATLKLSYHPAKFGGHSLSGNRVTVVFICHVTLQDHVFKALYDFMVWSPSM